MNSDPACARFEGRTVLVVGAGTSGPARAGELPMGNGRAMAMRFAAEGARVAVTDVHVALAEETVQSLGGAGLAIQADAADPEQCRAAVARVVEEYGRLDALVCNVGVIGHLSGRAQTVEDWERLMQVNVRAHWISAQTALPTMLEQGGGAMVFVTSTSGLMSSGLSLAYETTKAALLGVTRHFAVRYAARGVRANALALGVIDTPLVRREWGSSEARDARRDAMSPMGRQGRPEEAAAAAAFLASDDAGFVTGTCLVVDGGRTAGTLS